jgi:hypothetical protein
MQWGLMELHFKLKICNGFNSVCYIWWNKIPKGYEPLKYLVNSMLNWAEIEKLQLTSADDFNTG